MAPRKKTGGASAPSVPTTNSGVTARTIKVQTPDIQDKGGIRIVTTAVGAGPRGLIPIGTKMTVDLAAFSAKWMRPEDEAAVKALEKAKG